MNIKQSVLAASLVSAFAFATAQAETTVVTKTTETTTTTPVVEKVVEQPVVVETRVIEQPVVRVPVVVKEQVLVPLGGKIDKPTVEAVLIANGYHNVHDIDWLSHRGVWKAEARDATGDDREIHVDPYDGSIVHEEND